MWEPDEINIQYIKNNLSDYNNIAIEPYALWSEKTVLCFSAEGSTGSCVVKTNNGERIIQVQADSIDNIYKNDNVSFIKMDIEGAEMEALKGAENTILRCKPNLAICLYHSFEDLYSIPLFIKELLPEYKIYIRHHSNISRETVLYATL